MGDLFRSIRFVIRDKIGQRYISVFKVLPNIIVIGHEQSHTNRVFDHFFAVGKHGLGHSECPFGCPLEDFAVLSNNIETRLFDFFFFHKVTSKVQDGIVKEKSHHPLNFSRLGYRLAMHVSNERYQHSF